ncbi:unnamed protein product [Dovyalis caffra]|uniref:RBR-type E3 ubiquitin transferase n=1 Tax=Dovyalis caffra TaxID=77055 RepID=A0AAV1SBC3_9ROSI|nr:unnamed protein product [Dovyalis caffra]
MGDYSVISDGDYDYCYQDCEYYNCDYDSDGDSMEDDGYLMETEIIEPINSSGPTSKVITKESLLAAQREDLRRVMDLLSLKEHHARALLIHYRWDVDKVLQLLVDKGKERLYADAGVTITDHSDLAQSQSSSSVECGVCFDNVLASEVSAMDCGHVFCNSCWTSHFIVKINEGQSRRIQCMTPQCNAVCDNVKVRHFVSARDPYLAEKFDRFLLESYVEDNRRVKWCPSVPHCGNAIQVDDDVLCEVECACGVQFCFSCSSEAHSPCSCRMWECWSKKCQDESETVNWITVHTKPCPKCHKAVEKNGGCNLVRCICGQAFCWLCGCATGREHTWERISGHSCGRYKDDHEKKAACAERNLARYIHYHNRYKAHLDSFKLESDLKEAIRRKVSKLEEKESTSKDFSWITNGQYMLSRSRHILSLTYVLAFYMFDDNTELTSEERRIKKDLFEDQQQQFEGNVEKLSLLLEEQFDEYGEDKIENLRMRIIAVSVSTDNLCRNLYDCIENDLLGSQKFTVHQISPYRSKGVLRDRIRRREQFPDGMCRVNSPTSPTKHKRFRDHKKILVSTSWRGCGWDKGVARMRVWIKSEKWSLLDGGAGCGTTSCGGDGHLVVGCGEKEVATRVCLMEDSDGILDGSQ